MINVVFATHNGASTLPLMLDGFRKLIVPNSGWRIIAVDNASTDETADILTKYSSDLPIQVLYQQKPGKNAALNLALEYLDGDLIILTDDDIVPNEDWLAAYASLSSSLKQYSIFGGKIEPLWPRIPPLWFLEEMPLGMAFALTNVDAKPGPMTPGSVCGANMCVRREVFEEGLKFNEDIGPRPGGYVMGSETDFTTRAVFGGFKCWHYPDATVKHIIREFQMSPNWVVSRGFRSGRADGAALFRSMQVRRCSKLQLLTRYPKWRIRILLQGLAFAIVYTLIRNERLWFRNAYKSRYEWGAMYQFLRELKS